MRKNFLYVTYIKSKKETDMNTKDSSSEVPETKTPIEPRPKGRRLRYSKAMVSDLDWTDLKSVADRYSMSTRDGCQMFKVHIETWMKYFHDVIPNIAMPSYTRKTDKKGFIIEGGRDYGRQAGFADGVYHYDAKGFDDWFVENTKFHQRSKSIVMDCFVADPDAWAKTTVELWSEQPHPDAYLAAQDETGFRRYRKALQAWHKKCAAALVDALDPAFVWIWENRIGPAGRDPEKCPWIELETDQKLKEYALDCLHKRMLTSPNIMRNYGDQQETYFRQLHNTGAIRLSIFENEYHHALDGEGNEKPVLVRYLPDPDPFLRDPLPFVSRFRVVLNYPDYQRLKRQVESGRINGAKLPPLLEKTCLAR